MKMTIGARLRAAREARKLSMGRLSMESGVQLSTISLIEGGKRLNPGVETMTRLASALQVSLDELAGLKPAVAPVALPEARLERLERGMADVTSLVLELARHAQASASRRPAERQQQIAT